MADVDLFALGELLRVAVGPHVEADDDGVRRRRQQHVRLVDGADARVNDLDPHAIVAQLRQRVGEHFGRALHVGLDDDRQVLHVAFGDLLLQRFERQAAAFGAERLFLRHALPVGGDLPRLGGVGECLEGVAGLRQTRQAEHFDRRGRSGLLDRLAAVVDQRAHAARRSDPR